MSENLFEQDIPKGLPQKYLGLSWGKIILIAFMVIVAGIYIGNLLFGNHSVEALIQLQEYESGLKTKVKTLKEENALMQKEYFELKELTPQE